MGLDHEALAPRILRPGRPRLAEARAAVAGLEGPGEAWGVLAGRGLVDGAWAGEGVVHGAKSGKERRLAPVTVGACITLAADPNGVAEAELIAARLAWGLSSWVDPRSIDLLDGVQRWWGHQPEAIAWAVQPRAEIDPARELDLLADDARPERDAWIGLFDALHQVSNDHGGHAQRAARAHEEARLAAVPECETVLKWSAMWRAAVAEGFLLPVSMRPHETRLCPAASLPDVFELLIAIWRLGYAVRGITGDAVTLVAPGVDESE